MTAPPSTPSADAVPPGTAARALQTVRAAPLTIAVAALTTLVFAAQLAAPEVVDALQRGPGIMRDGQWWRLLGTLLVQPSGWGQFAYNTLGLVLVGMAVERRLGRIRWLALYLAAGLAGVVLMLVLHPLDTGGGSSDAVAGLIGALAVMTWRGWTPPLPAFLYAAHFALYLATFAAAGVIAATIAGAAAVALGMATHRSGDTRLARGVVVALVVAGAILMATLGDSHGAGLVTGLVLAALLKAGSSSEPMRARQ
ncbi:rhomboid family intramembrane serine protease [Catellatospora sichuanensis]|uniref:rhomboid family intramembrane serine protease n=1 Tax=Catellatospora sichuanensis TaxID=1969805 RepID=UPI0016434271|nr:rhomboid family intramembrane serine protease [Catellatospora sichuanensis]